MLESRHAPSNYIHVAIVGEAHITTRVARIRTHLPTVRGPHPPLETGSLGLGQTSRLGLDNREIRQQTALLSLPSPQNSPSNPSAQSQGRDRRIGRGIACLPPLIGTLLCLLAGQAVCKACCTAICTGREGRGLHARSPHKRNNPNLSLRTG